MQPAGRLPDDDEVAEWVWAAGERVAPAVRAASAAIAAAQLGTR